MARYYVGFHCPICHKPVNLLTDNLYDEFFMPWEDNYRRYIMPTHWVLHPCKHRLKELGVTEWGGIWWKALYPSKLENPQTVEGEGFNAFVECKQEADNPYTTWGDRRYYEWHKGWHRAREIAQQL